jgi:hypothetical protein
MLWFHFFFAHTLALTAMIFVCVWNGANFYVEVFSNVGTKIYGKKTKNPSAAAPPQDDGVIDEQLDRVSVDIDRTEVSDNPNQLLAPASVAGPVAEHGGSPV